MTDPITTANAIKAEIRACTTAQEIEALAAKRRQTVRAIASSGEQDGQALAHQIANLKAQRLAEIERNGK